MVKQTSGNDCSKPINQFNMAGLRQQPLIPIRERQYRTAATGLQLCQLEHNLGERGLRTLGLEVRKEKRKAPHVTQHEKEGLREGHRREASHSTIKRHILLFPCQQHADTKTKPKRGRHLCPGRLCSLAEQLQEPMAVTQSSKAAASDCSLLVRIPKLSQLTQGLSVKGRHISKCCKPCIANQPHYLHISLFCQVFSFLHPTKF